MTDERRDFVVAADADFCAALQLNAATLRYDLMRYFYVRFTVNRYCTNETNLLNGISIGRPFCGGQTDTDGQTTIRATCVQ